MRPPDAAIRHYRTQQQLAAKASTAGRHLWAGMRAVDFDGSWSTVGPKLQAVLTVAQARAAVDGAAYVPAVIAEQGIPDRPAGDVDVSGLAGVASSGGDLPTLLYGTVIRAKQLVGQGVPAPQALTEARNLLDGMMLTQVADAGRAATGLATVARPNLPGYVRMLNAPSCSRCVVLAGKTFHWNTGFLRHPRCDCVHIPVAEDTGADYRTDPGQYFDSIPAPEQDRIFGQHGAQAIRDGADIGQVVNARKGVQTATVNGRKVRSTTQAARGRLRLMPEQIYKDATSRTDAVRLLRRFGYIT